MAGLKFATSFVTPDEQSELLPKMTPAKAAGCTSAWFQAISPTPAAYTNNSQPTRENLLGGSAGVREKEELMDFWEARFGWKVDVLSAACLSGLFRKVCTVMGAEARG